MKTDRRALVVAAHPDDEILGCGATVAKLIRSGWRVVALIMAEGVTSRDQKRDKKLREAELSSLRASAGKAAAALGLEKLEFCDFPDNRMDSVPLLDVVKEVESAVERWRPSRIFTHFSGDLNVDHQIVNQAVLTACRPLKGGYVKEIFCFETVSSTEWSSPSRSFQPNWFELVQSDDLGKKLDALKHYSSEMREWPHPRSLEGIEILAKWRGMSCGGELAEAFYLERGVSPSVDTSPIV